MIYWITPTDTCTNWTCSYGGDVQCHRLNVYDRFLLGRQGLRQNLDIFSFTGRLNQLIPAVNFTDVDVAYDRVAHNVPP